MGLARRMMEAGGAALGAALSLGTKALGAAAAAVSAPLRLDGALASLADIASGVDAMHGEFVGMRSDILALDARVAGLRDGIEGVRAELGQLRGEIVDPVSDVSPMRAGVHRLERQVETVSHRLESVEALAARFGRLGKVRGRAKPVPQPVDDELAYAGADGAPVENVVSEGRQAAG
jgi:HAMP domain-containing protein